MDHILSETIGLFCFYDLFSNINPKIKIGLTYTISIVKRFLFFFFFFLRKYFLFFFADLLMFHNKIVKISEKLNERNLLKICLQKR